MNWLARALVALATGICTHVSASSGFGPVCGWDCWTPPNPSPKKGTNNTCEWPTPAHFTASSHQITTQTAPTHGTPTGVDTSVSRSVNTCRSLKCNACLFFLSWRSLTDTTLFHCFTYRSEKTNNHLVATSQWTSDPNAVHAYPHVKLGSPLLPIQFQHISLKIHAEWGLSRYSRPTPSGLSLDATGIALSQTVANVAYDIWADPDPNLAANESAAGIEIMIWLGVVGPAQPLGWNQHASCGRQALGDACLYVQHLPSLFQTPVSYRSSDID